MLWVFGFALSIIVSMPWFFSVRKYLTGFFGLFSYFSFCLFVFVLSCFTLQELTVKELRIFKETLIFKSV